MRKYNFSIYLTKFVLTADAQTVYGVFRYDKSRGDPCSGERLPYAASGLLSSRALWHHAGMLEEQARGQAHLWVPAEYTGGLLHCHREPVSAAALRHTHTRTHTLTRPWSWSGRNLHICNLSMPICWLYTYVVRLNVKSYSVLFNDMSMNTISKSNLSNSSFIPIMQSPLPYTECCTIEAI